MNQGTLRDFIVSKDLENELLSFVYESERDEIREWLKSEDLSN